MADRVVSVMHVEDEPMQQLMMRKILDRVAGFRFAITTAAGEEEAVATFHPGVEAVILDQQLSNGNGLSCLRRLRAAAPWVPILVLSGSDDPAVAADLLAAGADEFFPKDGLDPARFEAAFREALARSSSWDRASALPLHLRRTLHSLGQEFITALGNDFFRRLAECEREARAAGVTAAHVERAAGQLAGPADAGKLRPLLLELAVRLMD